MRKAIRHAHRPSPADWSVHLDSARTGEALPRATLCRDGRPVAYGRWDPRDPRGHLLWTDTDAQAAFTALATRIAADTVPTCRRPIPHEAAKTLMVYLVRQAMIA